MSVAPNPLLVAWSALVARRTAAPAPSGEGEAPVESLLPVLAALERGGLAAAAHHRGELEAHLEGAAVTDPDRLSRAGALAFWINLYNALAIAQALRAHRQGHDSVLRLPGAFRRTVIQVKGEALSLDRIEHGKVRRFKDPRIHGALICGTLSCPTLRAEPYRAPALDDQLDDQLCTFLAQGGARRHQGRLVLSRIFLWYGADFVRPQRMPTLVPSRPSRVAEALRPWLGPELRQWLDREPSVSFAPYDWSLGCQVA